MSRPSRSDLARRFSMLQEEELAEILTERASEHTSEALEVAREEAERRGGLDGLIARAEGARAVEEERAAADEARRSEVRRHYTRLDHVWETGRRWLAEYGLLTVAWVIISMTNRAGWSPARLLIGLFVLTALFIVYALIWGFLSYRAAVEDKTIVACPSCGRRFWLSLRALREGGANEAPRSRACPSCGATLPAADVG